MNSMEARIMLPFLNDCKCLKTGITAAKNRTTSTDVLLPSSWILIIECMCICSSGDPDFLEYSRSCLSLARLQCKKKKKSAIYMNTLATLDTNPRKFFDFCERWLADKDGDSGESFEEIFCIRKRKMKKLQCLTWAGLCIHITLFRNNWRKLFLPILLCRFERCFIPFT